MQEQAVTAARDRRPWRDRPEWATLSRSTVWIATGFGVLVPVVLVFAPGAPAPWTRTVAPIAFGLLAMLCALVTACAAVRTTVLAPVWVLLTGVVLLFATADLGSVAAPGPGISGVDALFGAGYLVLVSVPFVFLRRLRLRPHPTVWIDGLSTGLGALAVAVAVVLGPASTADDPTMLALAYVGGDLVLLALLASLASVLGSFRAVLLPTLAVALQLVADLGQYDAGGTGAPTDLLYAVPPVLLAWAAHRCPAGWAVHEQSWRPRLQVRRMVLPLGGATGAVLVLTWSALDSLGVVPVLLAAAALVSAAARTVLTLRATETFYELRTQALSDPLTGLGNRRELDAALTRALAEDTTGSTALLLLDLDSFRDVNDALGHAVGDEVLCLQAARLAGGDPAAEVAVRLEGDTFALVLRDVDLAGAREVAAEMATRLRTPLHVGGTRVRLTASVGVAVVPAGTRPGPATLLRRAHEALNQAKRRTEAVVVHVTDEHSEVEVSRLQLAGELHTAITEGQLVLWFQPQLHVAPACPVSTGGRVTTVAGCEALVRWAHPTRGLLGPDHILSAAEHGRLLPALGDAVLRLAVTAAATWWDVVPVPVSINLSATDLGDARLPDRVFQLLQEHHLPPWALTVEVVEDTLMLDAARVADVLGTLREMGVGIAIDDYGTGYSSLSYLHQLPVDELKLDRSLTRDLATSQASAAIARHSIALAHDLGLRVVGEGIEEPEALDALVALGCDTVQGYLTGRPMPLAGWTTWLAEQTAPPVRVVPAAVGS